MYTGETFEEVSESPRRSWKKQHARIEELAHEVRKHQTKNLIGANLVQAVVSYNNSSPDVLKRR